MGLLILLRFVNQARETIKNPKELYFFGEMELIAELGQDRLVENLKGFYKNVCNKNYQQILTDYFS